MGQTLDYASWVQSLAFDDIAQLYEEKNGGKRLEEGFEEAFGGWLPDELNQSDDLVIVSSDLDSSTKRVIAHLTDTYGVSINAVFFRRYEDDGRNYLARTWLVDPHEAERKASKAPAKKGQEPWDGTDFYGEGGVPELGGCSAIRLHLGWTGQVVQPGPEEPAPGCQGLRQHPPYRLRARGNGGLGSCSRLRVQGHGRRQGNAHPRGTTQCTQHGRQRG